MGAVVTRGVTTMGAEIASRNAVLRSLDDLVALQQGEVQGDLANDVTLSYFEAYNPPPARCQRECRRFEPDHPLVLTAVAHERQRRLTIDGGASYDDPAAPPPHPRNTIRFASK